VYLKNFQLFNYKSFKDSGTLEFSPGINIIVGQNNAGKTALLEALTLKLSKNPHRSTLTLPNHYSRTREDSFAKIELIIEKNELKKLLEELHEIESLGILEPSFSQQFLQEQDVSREEELKDIAQKNRQKLINDFTEWLDKKDDIVIGLSLSSDVLHEIDKNTLINLTLDFSPIYHNPDYSLLLDLNRKETFITLSFNNDTISILKESYQEYNEEYNEEYEAKREKIFLGTYQKTIGYRLFDLFRNRIYRFHAERLNIHKCEFKNSAELKPDASNLAEVLCFIKDNPPIKDRLNNYLSKIFPHIKVVSSTLNRDNQCEIKVWTNEAYQNKREDLTFSLSDCGTGVSQVLAILYVVVASKDSRTIIIDEPQSFLHPGAAKKLIDVLKSFPQHQYIISTHSPMLISTSDPSKIICLNYDGQQTTSCILKKEEIEAQKVILDDLGVKLSDVFGADSILWVEGPTEEKCFPLIIEKLLTISLNATFILQVQTTGQLEGKKAESFFAIYNRLSGGKFLMPPAIAFVLDSENRTEKQKQDLQRMSELPIHFLERKMYENYLLCPEAISAVIYCNIMKYDEDDSEKERLKQLASQDKISTWIEKNKSAYLSSKETVNSENWKKEIDAAKLLEDLFNDNELTEMKIEYRKTTHSYELTEWLIKNKPEFLSEMSNFLQGILEKLSDSRNH
jgi:predicted ATP-dependent endonuclease of OLD family